MNDRAGGAHMDDNTVNLGDALDEALPQRPDGTRKGNHVHRDDEYRPETKAELAAAEKMPERTVQAAVKLRLRGATYPEIAEFLGYQSTQTLRVAVEQAIGNMLGAEGDFRAMRNLHSARYENIIKSLWAKASTDTITLDGKKVANPDHLAYVREMRATLDSYARLHGLNAPQVSLQVTPDSEAFEQAVAMLTTAYRTENDSEEADIFAIEEGEPVEEQ